MSRRIYKRVVGAVECPVKISWYPREGEWDEVVAVTIPDMLNYKGERYPFVMNAHIDRDSAEWTKTPWIEKAYQLARYTWATLYETQGPEHYNTLRMKGVWTMLARHLREGGQLREYTDDIFPDSPRPVGVIPIATHDKRG